MTTPNPATEPVLRMGRARARFDVAVAQPGHRVRLNTVAVAINAPRRRHRRCSTLFGDTLGLWRSRYDPFAPDVAIGRVPARTRHFAERTARHLRALTVTTRIGAAVSAFFGVQGIIVGQDVLWIAVVNLASSTIFLLIPLVYRFGELVAPLLFFFVAYTSITVLCWHLGTGSGLPFFYLVAATLMVLILGSEHLVLASALAALGAATVIALELLVPYNTGVQPDWAFRTGFILSVITAWIMVVAVVSFALREIRRAREAMEAEYERSERLLTNILPATIAERLKDPSRNIIADKYDDASILFADIGGYTKRASDTPPGDLVRFLDRLYTDLDALVDRHGLEKIKTSGDSRWSSAACRSHARITWRHWPAWRWTWPDAVADLKDPRGASAAADWLAAGPVVAGVSARGSSSTTWGDAVNVAARMETTDVEGRIQVPHNVYERLNHAFVFEERGEVDIKGKGVMHTWYLVARRDDQAVRSAVEQDAAAGNV
jgi:adenylate cyclase